MGLKRGLGLFSTTMYGLGVIFGAGIFALISIGAGLAGNTLWLAFFLSALIAIFTAFSYAELSSAFPKEAAEYTYTRKAFHSETFSFAIGWVIAIGTMIAAATVAIGFGGYLQALSGIDPVIGALAIIIAMSILNYIGINESAKFNNIATSFEVLGLLAVIVIGFISHPTIESNLLELPSNGISGIIAAVSVVFFAYIGFENLTNLSEEVKDSRKTIPMALMLSLGISTIIYILVAVAAVREVGWSALSQSNAPLTLVVSATLGRYSSLLSYIALFATANTVLMFLIVPSRIFYGMSKGGSLPKFLSVTGSRKTPMISVAIVGVLAALFASAFDIKTVAQLANLAVFFAYLAVNASLIILANSDDKRSFFSPRIFGIPVLAWLGVLSTLFMLANFEARLWLMQIVVIGIGLVFFLFNRTRNR